MNSNKDYVSKNYIANMDKIIRQNCLKYKGLDTSAKEFVPSENTIKKIMNRDIKKQNELIKSIEDENAFFDRLEYEFVQQNVWFFE